MSETTTARPVLRSAEQADQRWFFGRGVHSWLATAEETAGAFLLFSDVMDKAGAHHCTPIRRMHRCTSSMGRSSSTSTVRNTHSAPAASSSPPVRFPTPSWCSQTPQPCSPSTHPPPARSSASARANHSPRTPTEWSTSTASGHPRSPTGASRSSARTPSRPFDQHRGVPPCAGAGRSPVTGLACRLDV